ncbi:TetR family transcriptional regulator [Mycolicibacterium moriokaense]|jgi:AcrR family transcriptional regulator|uniref:Transcriptional regulator, TetR family protein n=1 Tax=Mycolicibacterium moriokaense TaxID=39691 RepID=A0AAD1M400_9MYCO|nr:TetR/AcrR family transcriptional regulator [Mycolicibacterium moriokaense]MCV7037495.1 TetR/AcrR family transcriptional regulator [Mycolicibacterium moriokaense]ORB14752.1 TetR family transcriptional regulator [Mycolicibacterium moriokaense]BBW99567.1 putative transcriptional regulator, TetR family protein [Mycolicibacterium moriokaense]
MATSPGPVEVNDEDLHTRDQILEAALLCFAQLGIQRTSIQDVANMARVARGTVYRYFEDRKVLVEAAIRLGGQKYYRTVAAAMADKQSLAEQLGAMAEAQALILLEHRTRNRLMADDAEFMRHMFSDGDSVVRRSTEFLKPYVREAQERGEVGPRVDIDEASEWLARMMHSLSTVNGAQSFDMTQPDTVGRFVETFAVNGLR